MVKMAGDGPKLVLKVSRLPESPTQTIASLEFFLRDVVAGLVSLISGAHEEYDFGDRRGLSRGRVKANLEETHEGDCLHRIRLTGCSSG